MSTDLARWLAVNDMDIWQGDEPPDAEDVLSSALQSLDAMAGEFKGLGNRLDAQAQYSGSMLEQMQTLNRTMALMVQTQLAMKSALVELSKSMTAPRRIIKNADGKPIGVEVMKD